MISKIAVYLDQVHNDPIQACELVAGMGITNICLRRVWSTFLSEANQDVHIKLQQALSTYNLNVALIDCGLGTQIIQTADESARLDKICKICNAYNCQQLSVQWGKRIRSTRNVVSVSNWVDAVSAKTLEWSIQPLYHLSVDGAIIDPAVIAKLLQTSKRWKLLYDPSALVSGGSNHITKYWSLLNPKVWGMIINDSLPGSGKCVLGDGNGKLDILLSDWARSGSKFWLILKPNIRYNTVILPQFINYLDQLQALAKRIGILDNIDINWPQGDNNARHDRSNK